MNERARTALVLIIFTLAGSFAAQSSVQAAQRVSISEQSVGTIIIRTGQRRLYLITAPGQAISYPVGVGRASKQWTGESYIRFGISSTAGSKRKSECAWIGSRVG